MLNDVAIILQGPILYSEEIVDCYKKVRNNIIISTNYIDENQEKILLDNSFFITRAKTPKIPGKYNFNNQVATTHCGVISAKAKKFKYCLKIRSDIMINNVDLFIEKIEKDKTYFSAIHTHDSNTYLCEHMIFSDTVFMEKLWDIPESNANKPPEVQLTKRFLDLKNSGDDVKFLFPIIYDNEIEVNWIKYNKNLKDFQYDEKFSYDTKKLRFM